MSKLDMGNKLSSKELEKISQFNNKQMDIFRNNTNIIEELDKFAYSFITAKELKIVARVLNKIKDEEALQVKEKALEEE